MSAQSHRLARLLLVFPLLLACALFTAAPTATPAPPSVLPPAVTPTQPASPSATPSEPAPLPSPTPEAAALRVAIHAEDDGVQLVDTGFVVYGRAPLFQGLMPFGGAVGSTVYRLSFDGQPQIERVDQNGTQTIDMGQIPTFALAVWPGSADDPPRLAFGTSPGLDSQGTMVIAAGVDGSGLTPVVIETQTQGSLPHQLMAQRWSADGRSLYYSREPTGIGGYIPFSGASSLFRYDFADQSVTQLVPFDPDLNFLCLGDLSADAALAVGNCTDRLAMTVYHLDGTGPDTTIQPPSGLSDFNLIGSARLSPDASRVAFALARGNLEDEQGWVAVSDGLSGEARLVAVSDSGSFYTVAGWLDGSTLLLQQQTVTCAATCPASLWTVGVDGGSLAKLADGLFLAFVGSR